MRVLAKNISTGWQAAALAAITLTGATALALTTTSVEAAAILDFSSDGQLHGARNVEVDGKLYNVRFLDGACAVTNNRCSEAARFVFGSKKAATLAANALREKVLLDVMLNNAKANPELTVGCGASGLCVTLIPFSQEDTGPVGVPGFIAFTNDPATEPQEFESPQIDSAALETAPGSGPFGSGSGSFRSSGLAAQGFSRGPSGVSSPTTPANNPGGSGGSGPGGSGSGGSGSGGSGSGGGDGGPSGGSGGSGGGGTGGGSGSGGGTGSGGSGGGGPQPGPTDPTIAVFEPVDAIKVPEPSTLFIFGFALLAMAGMGLRQNNTALAANRARRRED